MRTTITALLTLIAAPLALTAPPPASTTAPSSATVTPPQSYYLKTRVVGPGHHDKDGLYVSNYHTGMYEPRYSRQSISHESIKKKFLFSGLFIFAGAGTADLTLQSIASASPAFFNSGYQEFDLDPPEPFGISMGDYDHGGTGTFHSIHLLTNLTARWHAYSD